MTSESMDSTINRRRFIKASVAAAAAATAAGTGVALLRDEETPIVSNPIVSNPLPQRFQPPTQILPESNEQLAEMFKRLASAEADNVRLQSQLNNAKRRLEYKETTKTAQIDNEQAGLLSQLDDMSLQVGVLSGLVALYNQLDDIDLDQTVTDGLAAVDSAIDELIEGIPTVAEGIELGQAALDELEEQIPILEDGRQWLEEQLTIVDSRYNIVERTLNRVVESGGSFLNMLEEWFQGLLKWLPFGIGRKASEVMAAISDLTTEIPGVVEGINVNVVRPLGDLLEKDDDQPAIQRRVITPVRESALRPAAKALDDTHSLEAIYQKHLSAPTRWNMERKQAVLASIKEYKQTHQL